MIIYSNTFENIKTINKNFPIEDQYYAKENEAIIADGITRDPIGINDFSKCTEKEFIEKYPRPSGAELASKEICNTFSKTKGLLKERLIKCNNQVKILNNKYIKECDYLENDYYGSVASCISINNICIMKSKRFSSSPNANCNFGNSCEYTCVRCSIPFASRIRCSNISVISPLLFFLA